MEIFKDMNHIVVQCLVNLREFSRLLGTQQLLDLVEVVIDLALCILRLFSVG